MLMTSYSAEDDSVHASIHNWTTDLEDLELKTLLQIQEQGRKYDRFMYSWASSLSVFLIVLID